MGDIADMMINGDMDYITGEYLGEGGGYPRTYKPTYKPRGNKKPIKGYKYKRKAPIHLTPAERKIASIRKEIAIMVSEQGITIGEARRLTNLKYGKDWRTRGLISNDSNQWTEEELKDLKK